MIGTSIDVLHDTEPRPTHRCEPRISAVCSVCKTAYALCTISDQGVRRILARIWTCSACRRAGQPSSVAVSTARC